MVRQGLRSILVLSFASAVALSGSSLTVEELDALSAEESRREVPRCAEWNVQALKFSRPPAFAFPPLLKFMNGVYRYTVTAGAKTLVFTNKASVASLAPVWDDLPDGWMTVTCEGVDDLGRVPTEPLGSRTFWKAPRFRPGKYPPPRRSFREAARMAFDWTFAHPYVKGLERDGVPSVSYELSVYPTKMLTSVISAAVTAGRLDLARQAADYLLSISQPKDAPLACFPPTYYFPEGYKGGGAVAGGKAGRENMSVYPLGAIKAYTALYAATKDGKYRVAATDLADSFLACRAKDGSWALLYDEKTGQPIGTNKLVPVRVEDAFASLADTTGERRYRQVADEVWNDLEATRLAEWDWEGQFEDQNCSRKYENLTHVDISSGEGLLASLLRRYPADPSKGADRARELLRFVEDQFVFWDCAFQPLPEKLPRQWKWAASAMAWQAPNERDWIFPCAVEQYYYYVPVDASVAAIIQSFLRMHKASGNPLDLEKAKALGATMTRRQESDGFIATAWNYKAEMRSTEERKNVWINCILQSAAALNELADACGEP